MIGRARVSKSDFVRVCLSWGTFCADSLCACAPTADKQETKRGTRTSESLNFLLTGVMGGGTVSDAQDDKSRETKACKDESLTVGRISFQVARRVYRKITLTNE